ncbi:uncharacterized protein LOC143278500, partial [Babylonia areolata]
TDVKSWLPYVLGVAGGAVVLAALVGVTWWRYGHRMEFLCRSPPSRGDSEADAVILHGEDHEQLVKETLLPGVRALGYDILEEVTTPGRLELPDRLEAVETSHSVLLTFSTREMAEDAQVNFLARYVFSRKTRSTVLFIRSQHHHNTDTDTTTRENGPRSREEADVESGQQRGSQDNNVVAGTPPPTLKKNAARNPWNNDTIRSFRVLNLPRSLYPGTSSSSSSPSSSSTRAERSWREARDVEKFWYSLQKGLPKAPRPRRTSRSGGDSEGRHRRRTNAGRVPSSTESQRPLMASVTAAGRSRGGSSLTEAGRSGAFPSTAMTSVTDAEPSATPTRDSHNDDDDDVFLKIPSPVPVEIHADPTSGGPPPPPPSQPFPEPSGDGGDRSNAPQGQPGNTSRVVVEGVPRQYYAHPDDEEEQEKDSQACCAPHSDSSDRSSNGAASKNHHHQHHYHHHPPPAKSDPRQKSLITRAGWEVGKEGGGKFVARSGGGGGEEGEEEGCCSLLESQESGYHSPVGHSHEGVPAFAAGQ